MNNSKKRGFTIVELVIVIAVIAILAGVLIPTFSSIVKKANLSADEQAVRQMNTALQIYTAENGAPSGVAEVKKALDENLINTESMIPVTQGYAFYWNPDKNEIVLVGADKATAENTWALLTSTGYGKAPETPVTDKTTFQNAVNASSVAEPVLIELDQDVSVDGYVQVDSGESVILDLGGKTISRSTGTAFYIKGGSLVVKNGKINAGAQCIFNDGGDVTLEYVDMVSSSTGQAAVYVNGISNTSIKNCNLTSTGYIAISTNSSSAENDGARLSIVDSTLVGKYAGMLVTIYADVTIDNCHISGEEHGAFFRGCNATISNSQIWNTEIDGDETSDNKGHQWTSGTDGRKADIVFACGGTESYSAGYITTGNFKCENVTGNPTALIDGKFTVVVHEPTGGKVTVSGIKVNQTFHEKLLASESWAPQY